MGIVDLMQNDDGWEMVVTFGTDDRRWRARLHKLDDAGAPVYFGVGEPGGLFFAAVQELDVVVTDAQKQEA